MSRISGCSEDGEREKLGNQFSHESSQLGAPKKKRNLPGTPDPDAVVVALSPETLMTTNRFVCEICNKGFRRDQNLQLHRRGHNLPWKLKQRTGGSGSEMKRRVYVCPEPTCVHHSPARALGDLTGVKKHFSRKHGEKKWKCEKCSKKYAVQSDLKAHTKTCGSKEYKCDCGTIFSRRDSFITHRAFCDALTEENNKLARRGAMASTMASPFQQQVPRLPSPPLTLPHDLMPIPPKPLNVSAGAMFSSSNSERNDHQFPSPSALMSATALLQKAVQMGAAVSSSGSPTTSSSMTQHKKGYVTRMAPSSFGGLFPQTVASLPTSYLQKCPQGTTSAQLLYDCSTVDVEMINDISTLNGMFDQPLMEATRKKMNDKNGAAKTMTLDLLGAEGAKKEDPFGGLMENMSYFRHQAAMGRHTWEI